MANIFLTRAEELSFPLAVPWLDMSGRWPNCTERVVSPDLSRIEPQIGQRVPTTAPATTRAQKGLLPANRSRYHVPGLVGRDAADGGEPGTSICPTHYSRDGSQSSTFDCPRALSCISASEC
jgi:hypothetical protein